MTTAAIVVASGRSLRFGGDVPKLVVPWRGRPLVAWTLRALEACPEVDDVVLVASGEVASAAAGSAAAKLVGVVPGGDTRQASVAAGLAALPARADLVLVHDGARPFVSPGLVARVVRAAREAGAAVPVLPVVDTLKRVAADESPARDTILETVPREALARAQTPQGFRRGVLEAAAAFAAETGLGATDDMAMVEALRAAGRLPAGTRLVTVPGEASNVKVTTPADLPAVVIETRVGLGHDVHPLERGRRFVLGGVDLQPGAADEERFGPAGHSDGDALAHALCDALLSAAGKDDIGATFPDTDPAHRGRASLDFVREVAGGLRADGWSVLNVSGVVRLERPRVLPFVPALREALGRALGCGPDRIGLSAKRGEGLGPVGEGRAVEADVVALIGRET